MAQRVKYNGSLDGSAPILKTFQVNDTQTVVIGDVMVLSSGKASLAADAAATATVLGVSNTTITTTTATAADIVHIDINPLSIYEMTYTGTAGSAEVGAKYDFGTAPYTLDLDDTTGGFLQIVPQPDGSALNTDKGTCLVVITNRAFGIV